MARHSRALKTTGKAVAAFALLTVLFVLLFDWNWLRGPIERKTFEKTGRDLVITGNLSVKLGRPAARAASMWATRSRNRGFPLIPAP